MGNQLRFEIVFKEKLNEVCRLEGKVRYLPLLTEREVGEQVIDTQNYLEKITGYRVHINLVPFS